MSSENKVNWILCQDRLPSRSGDYLVSRYGFVYDKDTSGFRLCPDQNLRYVDIALFVIDVGLFDTDERRNIYAWAELPKPA